MGNTENTPDKDHQEDEFSKLMNDGGLTEEDLQAKLNEYAKAYRQEFELSTQAAPDNVEEYTRDFFKKNIHSAAAQVVWLANNSTSDSIRLNASKFIISEALTDARADGDPIRELLAELGNND